ncbi:MAG: hypothetical protein ACD_12C00523G0001 [uncultured bacterium]|nr:MAG: hypothetical protein ACD_12C00523G0001 [uncultured bacterium]
MNNNNPAKIYLNIAGFNIQVNLKPTEWEFAFKLKEKEIKKYWKGFITNKPEKINFTINFIERNYLEVLYKKKEKKQYMSFFEEINSKEINTFYQISIFQFQVILRRVISILLAGNGFILHGSASNISGKAYAFTGDNGAGKSTTMKLLNPEYQALADDTIIIKKEKNKYYLYQTPFIEKEWWVKKSGQKLPLEKVYFLKKKKYFKEEMIKNKSLLFEKIIKQFWTENDEFVPKKTKLIYQFTHKFNYFYYLSLAKNKKKLLDFINNI